MFNRDESAIFHSRERSSPTFAYTKNNFNIFEKNFNLFVSKFEYSAGFVYPYVLIGVGMMDQGTSCATENDQLDPSVQGIKVRNIFSLKVK